MLSKHFLGALATAIFSASVLAADATDGPLVFNTTTPTNDLQGSLAAQVLFAQSQVIPARPSQGDKQPHLIGRRKALLLVRPVNADNETPIEVAVFNKSGKKLGELTLDPPEKLPKTAYYLDGVPDGVIDFTPKSGATSVIENSRDLEKLSNPRDRLLADRLRQNAVVEIRTADGRWVRDIHLPSGSGLQGKVVRVQSNAGYSSNIHYSGRKAEISRGQTLLFKHLRGQWIMESELENQNLVYATDAWSGVLPAEWIVPSLSLEIRQGDSTGKLTNVKVGAPTELLIHTIDIGMLVPPRGQFEFAGDPEAHREYFQTAPTSRLIVSQYAPVFLREVMLPDGTFLTESDPSKGDWHNGAMRQHIGKELISHGIDNANYGIHSSAGAGEGSHPYLAAQLTAHNSQGKYSNGVVVHGGSGGGGIVTLDQSIGNEFSHEVGHNYGLGHYVGGFEGSVHRAADQINSTWGWDADKNRFIPNFAPTRSGKDTCLDDKCQPPFAGRSFGFDPMAGGKPFSHFNRFTLYTPHTATIIQQFLESKVIFDASSPTGFRKWNAQAGKLEPYRHQIDTSRQITAPVNELSEQKLAALLGEYDVVKVAMRDGDWADTIPAPPAAAVPRGRALVIEHSATYATNLLINGQRVKVGRGFQKSFTSDGKRWKEGSLKDQRIDRKPTAFGVPVTTLVGYYDPAGQLKSYIYPALHGAYGFTYSDDGEQVDKNDCHLLVETREGPLRFRLANHRLDAKVMNKFHVNVPESMGPESVSLICRGEVIDKRPIAPATEKLTFTVHGASPRPLPRPQTNTAAAADSP